MQNIKPDLRFKYKKIVLYVAITLFGIWLLSGFYIVETHEEAVVQRFGKLVRDKVLPGIYYHLPWPAETATKIQVLKTERITVGHKSAEDMLDTVIIKRITGDVNIINVIATFQYRIRGAKDYLFNVENPKIALHSAAEAAITQVFGSVDVDYALTVGKTEIQSTVRDLTQEFMDEYSTGIQISSVNLHEMSPPKAVEQAFIDIINAQSDAKKFVNEASGYKNSSILDAEARANAMRKTAEGYYQEQINRAKGEADRFLNVVSGYGVDPRVNRSRMYIETVEEIALKAKKIILSEELDTTLIKIYGWDKEGKNTAPRIPPIINP
jgi:membrane protease subunit HflK